MSRGFRRRALTLPETLIAAALFGLAVSALLMAILNLMHGLERTSEISAERAFVRFATDRVLRITDRDTVMRGGSIALPDGSRAEWSARIDETDTMDLFRLELRLRFDDGIPSVCVTRLVYNPRWSDPTARGERLRRVRESRPPLGEGAL